MTPTRFAVHKLEETLDLLEENLHQFTRTERQEIQEVREAVDSGCFVDYGRMQDMRDLAERL